MGESKTSLLSCSGPFDFHCVWLLKILACDKGLRYYREKLGYLSFRETSYSEFSTEIQILFIGLYTRSCRVSSAFSLNHCRALNSYLFPRDVVLRDAQHATSIFPACRNVCITRGKAFVKYIEFRKDSGIRDEEQASPDRFVRRRIRRAALLNERSSSGLVGKMLREISCKPLLRENRHFVRSLQKWPYCSCLGYVYIQ